MPNRAPTRASAAGGPLATPLTDSPVRRSSVGVAALLVALLSGTMLLAAHRSDAATAAITIWSSTTTPRTDANDDDSSVELGTVFTTSEAGSVTGLRYYKSEENTGNHVGTLWSEDGTALATATFDDDSASGWQEATLSKPVVLSVGKRYTASYRAKNGRYAGDNGVFVNGYTKKSQSLTASAGVYTYGSGRPTSTYRGTFYYVDVRFRAAETSSTAPVSPTPTPAPSPTSTAPATSGDFPDSSNTGVPSGTTLSSYSGPCTITTNGAVIDAKTVGCDLRIRASGVKITRSVVKGSVATDENSSGYSFSISDSNVDVGDREGTGIGAVDFTATRVEVTGGNRSIHCYSDCTVIDSYVHAQFRDASGQSHESGIRMGSSATIRHNSITCDAPDVPPDAGCSAGLTGYGDFAAVQDNLVEGNQFLPTTGGYCAYGGSSLGKAYSTLTRGIVFRDNVFQRGSNGKCGYWGPITSFDVSLPGNVWSGNVWSDGTVVRAAN